MSCCLKPAPLSLAAAAGPAAHHRPGVIGCSHMSAAQQKSRINKQQLLWHRLSIGMSHFVPFVSSWYIYLLPLPALQVETVEQYDEYCHYVAGLVGIGLAQLFGKQHAALRHQHCSSLGAVHSLSSSTPSTACTACTQGQQRYLLTACHPGLHSYLCCVSTQPTSLQVYPCLTKHPRDLCVFAGSTCTQWACMYLQTCQPGHG